tara:strand:+ start:43 stop:888 length:846 start_codon:yes stop_codon:yes gene_type:complete
MINILNFPTERMFNILRLNQKKYIKHKRIKKFVKNEILNKDISEKEKFDRYNELKQTDFFCDKIHIDIRESSPQYVDERISIQFYKEIARYIEGASSKFRFVTYAFYRDRFSFEVNRQYDYDYLLEFIENKIEENYYFLDIEYLFLWILEKKDIFNRKQIARREKIYKRDKKNLELWEKMKREDRIKILPPMKEKEYSEYKKPRTYILKDKNTGYYKIGRSINPKEREKTLQSEKPTIKMIKEFKNDIENELHKKYSKNRVRGEWFKLNKIQLKYICTNYK